MFQDKDSLLGLGAGPAIGITAGLFSKQEPQQDIAVPFIPYQTGRSLHHNGLLFEINKKQFTALLINLTIFTQN